MNDLIQAIQAAVAEGATAEQKSTGAQACRTILSALGTDPGKPMTLPGTPNAGLLAGLTLDQTLDLVIARLTPLAEKREAPPTEAPPKPVTAPRIPLIPPPARPMPRANVRPAVVRRKP